MQFSLERKIPHSLSHRINNEDKSLAPFNLARRQNLAGKKFSTVVLKTLWKNSRVVS
jgi:hypothetical protein